MIDELDLEELTRPGAIIPVDLMTTAALVKHVVQLQAALDVIADIAEGSTTANSLPNLARIARHPESIIAGQKDAE